MRTHVARTMNQTPDNKQRNIVAQKGKKRLHARIRYSMTVEHNS